MSSLNLSFTHFSLGIPCRQAISSQLGFLRSCLTDLSLRMIGLIFCVVFAGCSKDTDNAPSEKKESSVNASQIAIWPKVQSEVPTSPQIENRIAFLLEKMTLEQKVAQMIQPEIRDITVEDMRKYGFGSYLNGGGAFPNNNKYATPEDWIALAESLYQASVDDSLDGSTIPTMWGTDAVHGHNNVIGATLFPHNIGLGAANNPKLIEQIAHATAIEVMATGIDWVFAPTVATVRDDRWGRTYEGYSEDPEIVKAYSSAIVHGLQGRYGSTFMQKDRVISTVKHFLGDGGTVGGDDQGNNIDSEQHLFDIHAQGYVGGLSAGAQTVMASFNSWHGKKNHGNKYLLTDVLKEKMGFDGFIVGDWNGHGQIQGCTNDNCPQAVNAGLDVFMVPTKAWKPLYENTIEQVKQGVIPESRIDDAVRRILRVKLRSGLFDKPSPANREFSGKLQYIGADKHRAIARDAVRQSLVLLKNNEQLLPLAPDQKIFITGDGAHNIGKAAGGWSISWQGTGNKNEDFPGATSIYQGFKNQVEAAGGTIELGSSAAFNVRPDVAIVVFGEDPYAEGHGDRSTLAYQRGDKSDLEILKTLKELNIPVVSVFITGRPLWINPELNASDAFVVAWLPGTEGEGVADVLLTSKDGSQQYDTTGRLSYSWPASPFQTTVNRGDEDYKPLFRYGYGLSYSDKINLEALSEDLDVEEKSTYKGRDIHVGTLLKPWEMWLVGNNKRLKVETNALSLPDIQYRTFDKDIQEDAFQITANASSTVELQIESKSSFREDLSSDLVNQASLSFDYQVSQALNGDAWLNVRCEGGENCGAKKDVSALFKRADETSWTTFSIPLTDLKDKGMKFADTVRVLGLEIDGKMQIRIANIKLVKKAE